MPRYLVTYYCEIEVEALDEDEAIEIGIQEWEDQPDGSWDATLIEEQ
jgi:hypothetical protein